MTGEQIMAKKLTEYKWEVNKFGNIVSAIEPGQKYQRVIAVVKGNIAGMCQGYPTKLSTDQDWLTARLIAKAPEMFDLLCIARLFVSKDIRADIEKVLYEIDPDFDKLPDVTDIKKFAERVKNMRDWQKERTQSPDSKDADIYSKSNEDLVDSLIEQILQEVHS